MKIRIGFVSNSSSSSFVCDVCGEEVSGWDMSVSEAEMVQCENGHTFCEEHMKKCEDKDIVKIYLEDSEWQKELSKKVKKMTGEEFNEWYEEDGDDILREAKSEGISHKFCPICSMDIVTKADQVRYLMKVYKITRQEVLDEIKKENKRRKKAHDDEYIKYVYAKENVKDIDIEIMKKFKTYDDFEKFLLID